MLVNLSADSNPPENSLPDSASASQYPYQIPAFLLPTLAALARDLGLSLSDVTSDLPAPARDMAEKMARPRPP